MLGLPLILVAFVLLIVIAVAVRVGTRVFGQITKLSFQNKLLVALRHLDIVVLPITEVESICQEIVNVIREELGYFFGAIALIDNKAGGLRRIAISNDPKLNAIIRGLPIEYKKQVVPLTMTDNLLIKVINERKSLFTARLHDIQVGILATELSDQIQETIELKGLFIHPLVVKNGVIGVIYYATLLDKKKLSHFEFEIMDEFTREVSRILENVFLYQDLKIATRQLTEANKKLKELDKLKDEFLSVASHELRTPMTNIKNYLWMALHKSDQALSQNLRKYLERAFASASRLISLVNDMLDVSHLEQGKIEINQTPLDIVALVNDVVAGFATQVQGKEIDLKIAKTSRIPKVMGDSEKVYEIFINLIGNACKFTPRGGKVKVGFTIKDGMVETSVSDTGVGIKKADISRLFQKFGRLDNSYTAAAENAGTGLGLYICKLLVDLHHGQIWATSQGEGRGATFTFSLPRTTLPNKVVRGLPVATNS